MSRIFVTGIGIISPLGNNLEENHNALKTGTCGISNLELFKSKYSDVFPVGEIKLDDQTLKETLIVDSKGITRTTLLALHSFQQALEDSGLSARDLQSSETALIGATTVGGICMTDELYCDANNLSQNSENLGSYDMASVFLYLQSRYKIGGVINTINTACSSSANSISYGARLIQQGYAKRAIVGGVDSLAKFTLNGFNSLMILSQELCKPFDKDRTGLNLGEAAAFLVLEKEEDVQNKKVYAELKGFANANDAFHPSSLSDAGDGPYLSMQNALINGNLTPADIDFINAHGTGTENNDLAESNAMLRLFGKHIAFASTKSNTGHTLGAAAAIEAVYCILNLQHQETYSNLRFKNPIPETGLLPVENYSKKTIKHVMSNSFGFGGNCSSLIFSSI
ncbi:MAG: beta-ketoacyl-[acyl-carrier-protein] synthase family protein [Opitutaceae bacterium]|nr:beta-ketoacyl-[acyl-carrier-protein] synthase family protein [Cytophagales bacterium]